MVPNSLIELGATISVMTKETMLNINLQWVFSNTTIVLLLVDRSTIDHEGFIKDVMVFIES